MKIGIPREIKNNENRVGLSPSGVHALVESGRQFWLKRMRVQDHSLKM